MKSFLVVLCVLLACIFLFCIAVLVAGTVNKVDFYDQLCLWFGHESGFARIFGK